MGKYKTTLILALIVVLSFFLRIYKISSVPPALGNDEIAIAYDAYSIAKTGRDSHGEFLPLSFRSYDDYKAPLNQYIAAITITLFGNTELAVRLPSVLFGVLTVLTLFLLVRKLTGNKSLALLSAFLLALTPWQVYTSRTALSTDIALSFLISGIYFFLKGAESKIFLYLSGISLALSAYAYHSEKVLAPMLMVILTVLFWKKYRLKKIVLWWFVFVLFCLPLVYDTIFGGGSTRPGTEIILNDLVLQNQLAGVGNLFSRLYIIFSFWLDKYLGYQGLSYIFIHGMDVSANYGISDFGLLNLAQLPFFLLGVFYIARNSKKGEVRLFALWALFGPLVPSITEGDLNLIRNLPTVIPLTVICAWGIIYAGRYINTKLVLAVVVVCFLFFYRYYITQFPFHFAESWTYGFKEIAQYIDANNEVYKKFVIDPRFGVVNNSFIGVPSMYILYFNNLDPQKYLETKVEGDNELNFMEKYNVRQVDWTQEQIDPDTLYVVSSHGVPLPKLEMEKVYYINLPDGTEAFRFYRKAKNALE